MRTRTRPRPYPAQARAVVGRSDREGHLPIWHPHLHLLASDGGFTSDGRFLPLPEWDATLLMTLFRERILARLLDRHAIAPELVRKLPGWRHPGFSTHVGEPIDPQDGQRLEDTSCKRRGVCPSCGAKRAAELAAFLQDEVVEPVGHTQWVFTIPRMLRMYFRHHRELLGGLLSQERIERLHSWRRSGFSVHNRVFVHPRDGREFEALVRYMMRPPVSLARLHFTPGAHEVVSVPKTGHDESERAALRR